MNNTEQQLRGLLLDWATSRPDPDWDRVVDILAAGVDGWQARRLLSLPRLPDRHADRVAAAAPAGRADGILEAMKHSVWTDALRAYAGRPAQLSQPPVPGAARLPVPQPRDVLRFRADPRWPAAVGGAPDAVKTALVTAGRRRPDVSALLVADPRLDLGDHVEVFTDQAGNLLQLAGALDPTIGVQQNLDAARACGLEVLADLSSDARSAVVDWLTGTVLAGTGDRWLLGALAGYGSDERLGPWTVTPRQLAVQRPLLDELTLDEAARHVSAGWVLVAALDSALPSAAQWRAALRLAGRFDGTATEYLTAVQAALI